MGKQRVRETLITGIFFAGFLLGIFFVDLWGDTYLRDCSFLNRETLQMIRQTQIDARAFFRFLLCSRGKVFLLFWLLGYTAAGILAALPMLGWLGFSAGMFGCLCVNQMGPVGVLFYLAALLPQMLFYAPMVWIAANAVYDRSITFFYRKRAAVLLPERRQSYTKTMFLCLALLLAGAVLESCANPWLLKQTIAYFQLG